MLKSFLTLLLFLTIGQSAQADNFDGDLFYSEPEFSDRTIEEPDVDNWDATLRELKGRKAFKKSVADPKEVTDRGWNYIYKMLGLFENLTIDLGGSHNIDIIDGVAFRVGYGFEAKTAYFADYFSRMDEYEMGLKVGLLSLIGVDDRYSFNIQPGITTKFYQFFKTVEEARDIRNAYTPLHLPTSSERALKKLKPGDLVVFEGELDMTYGYGKLLEDILSRLRIVPTIGGLISGQFRMVVYRGDNKIVRVRLSATRNTPRYVQLKIGILDALAFLDFGWGWALEQVEKLLKLDRLVQAKIENIDQDIWLADFTLDMKDPRVRSAYDMLFERGPRLKALTSTANPFLSNDELRDRLFLNLDPLTELAYQELNKSKPVVRMNFMGSNFSFGGMAYIEAGVRGAFRGQSYTSQQRNRLKQRVFADNGDFQDNYYYFPSWSKKSDVSGNLSLITEQHISDANVIYRSNDKFKIKGFENLGYYRETRDKRYRSDEHAKIMASYSQTLPPMVYERLLNYLRVNGWSHFLGERRNVRITSQYFLTEGGLKKVEGLTKEQILKQIVLSLLAHDEMTGETIKNKKKISGKPRGYHCSPRRLRRIGHPEPRKRMIGTAMARFCKFTERLARQLEKVLDPELEPAERNRRFVSIAQSRIFTFLGPKILFEALGEKDFQDSTYFELIINASHMERPLRFSHGRIQNRALFDILLQMERAQKADHSDMRIPGTEETLTTRILE